MVVIPLEFHYSASGVSLLPTRPVSLAIVIRAAFSVKEILAAQKWRLVRPLVRKFKTETWKIGTNKNWNLQRRKLVAVTKADLDAFRERTDHKHCQFGSLSGMLNIGFPFGPSMELSFLRNLFSMAWNLSPKSDKSFGLPTNRRSQMETYFNESS